MTPLNLLIAATLVAIEAGWQPLPEGGHEYTIQIEPPSVSMLQNGNDLISEIPSNIDIRRLRITLGTGSLARIDGPPKSSAPPSEPSAPAGNPPEEAIAAPHAGPDLGDTPPPAEPTPAKSAAQPANFNEPAAGPKPLGDTAPPDVAPGASAPGETAPGDATEKTHAAERPQLTGVPDAASEPWLPFVLATTLLACSLGANLYLGWIAWDARHRYRDALAKVRTA
jgi:hypothetical protein